MLKKSQAGSAATVAVIVLLCLALAGSAGFGYWAFSERQDYKSGADKKIAQAVTQAQKNQEAKLKAEFEASSKNPLKAFRSSATFGSITFGYPRTWSAYVDETNSSQPINGYFHPNQVPGVQGNAAYALRLELVNESYASSVNRFDSQVKAGKLRASAYVPPKMKDIANVQPGVRLDGAIAQGKQGAMVIIKIRDKTLKISSQSPDFVPDFNNIILSTLSFTP